MTKVHRYYVRIGEICREMRERNGQTQAEVASAIGWQRPALSILESGQRKIDLDDLPKLAKALGIPLGDLLAQEFHQQ